MKALFAKDLAALQLIQGNARVCRICHMECEASQLANGHDTHIIKTEYSTNCVTLFDILRRITNQNVEAQHLPYEFCPKCCQQLLSHYIFTINCLEQEKRLHNLINPLSQQILDCINVKSEPEEESRSYYLFAFNTIEESTKWKAKKRKIEVKSEDQSLLVMKKSTKRTPVKNGDNTDLPVNEWTCEICGKMFTIKRSFQNHRFVCKNKGKSRIDLFLCEFCSRTCKGKRSLQQHRFVCKKRDTTLFPDTDLKFTCDLCKATFYSKGRLNTHMKTVHVVPSLPCEICGKKFKTQKQVRQHSITHSDEKRRFITHSEKRTTFPCEFCGKVLAAKESLRCHRLKCKYKHIDVVPDPNRTFICDLCNITYYSKGRLHYHMQTVHVACTIPCKICGKMFKTQKTYQSHLTVHSDERNHMCGICHNSYKTANSLICHLRIHTGERPYQCSMCDRRFITASRRREHFLAQHCEKSAECKICNSKFSSNCRVQQHMKKVHFKGLKKVKSGTLRENEQVHIRPRIRVISEKLMKKSIQK